MTDKHLKRAFSKISFLLYSVAVEDGVEHIAQQYIEVLLEDFDASDIAEIVQEEPPPRLSGWLCLLARHQESEGGLCAGDWTELIESALVKDDEECRYHACKLAISLEDSVADEILREHTEREEDEVILSLIEEHLMFVENCL